MIEARLSHRFSGGRESLPFSLDLAFATGEGVTALFGSSGAGKTLTLDCIAGFVRPTAGRILLNGRILFDGEAGVHLPPRKRRCGYVFQNYALFPHLTARQNILFGGARWSRVDRTRKADALLELFGLTGVSGSRPHALSGGQKQRCSIARALIGSPEVLLLDEPARGLDALLRAELYGAVRQTQKEFGTPVLLVTHDLEECFELASRMVVLRDGRIVQEGPPAAVCSQPVDGGMAALLGLDNVIPAEIVSLDPSRNRSVLRVANHTIAAEYLPGHLLGDRLQLLVSPAELRAYPRLGSLGENQIPVRLQRAVPRPGGVRLQFAGGFFVEQSAAIAIDNEDWVIEFPRKGLRLL